MIIISTIISLVLKIVIMFLFTLCVVACLLFKTVEEKRIYNFSVIILALILMFIL